MKWMPMPREASWWAWLVTVLLLGAGLAGWPAGFVAAIALSLGRTLVVAAKEKSLAPIPVQILAAYTALLALCLLPGLRWLYWVPTLGTAALLLFGYCLLARLLSLLPWNRQQPFSMALLGRTLAAPPQPGNTRQGLPGCRCLLEARAGARPPMELGKTAVPVDRVSPQ